LEVSLIHSFLTSTLDAGELVALHSSRITLKQRNVRTQ
jgi:hypothetical protein